jgi:MraZ protein
VPSTFRALIERQWGTDLYLTSLSPTGASVRIYPLKIWEDIEARLRSLPSLSQARQAFEMTTSYWGQVASIDAQGRVVIPAQLREAADISADVAVMGLQTSLEIWNDERLHQKVVAAGLGPAHFDELAALGM